MQQRGTSQSLAIEITGLPAQRAGGNADRDRVSPEALKDLRAWPGEVSRRPPGKFRDELDGIEPGARGHFTEDPTGIKLADRPQPRPVNGSRASFEKGLRSGTHHLPGRHRANGKMLQPFHATAQLAGNRFPSWLDPHSHRAPSRSVSLSAPKQRIARQHEEVMRLRRDPHVRKAEASKHCLTLS